MALVDDSDVRALQEIVDRTMDEEEVFGIIPMEQTVIIRVYSDDADDLLLSDTRPRFIVMYEPNQEFIRRVEVRARNLDHLQLIMSFRRYIVA
jgi:DNA excision repair protein ERCC-4